MTHSSKISDTLKVEGIMAQGYGLNPKIVMRDKRLTPEAKAIYAYFSSFAGAGNQAFPSRDLMLEELGMSVKRYYNHLKLLLVCDYIKIERTKTADHRFDRNTYIIVASPNPVCQEGKEGDEKAKNSPVSVQNEQSGRKGTKRIKVGTKASLKALREQLGIESLKEKLPEQKNLVEDIFMAIEDMANSEQINIGGSIKKKEAIQDVLSKLNDENVKFVLNNLSKTKSKITNKKAYLQACICNSIFDTKKINTDVDTEKMKKEEAQKAEEERLKERKITYLVNPELKLIDDKIAEIQCEIAKNVLFGNNSKIEMIRGKMDKMVTERDFILSKSGKQGGTERNAEI